MHRARERKERKKNNKKKDEYYSLEAKILIEAPQTGCQVQTTLRAEDISKQH